MPYTVIGGIGLMTLANNASSTNEVNIMTLNNVIMLAGDITVTNYTAGEPFATLSDETMFPAENMYIPIYIEQENTLIQLPMIVNTSGEFSLPNDYDNATIKTNGIMFHVNSKFYTIEIGNVFNDGTSPLSEA